MKVKLAGAVTAAVILCSAVPVGAATQVYSAPDGLAGNQAYGGTLGLNFTVNSAVTVDSIGVFDGSSDGLAADLRATIFTASGVSLLTPVLFASGTPSSGSAYIFQSIAPLVLAPGSYQLAAWGYNQSEMNYNNGGSGGPITFNTLGGQLTATGTAYSSDSMPGVFATNPDSGLTRYGAGSFTTTAVAAAPEPSTWVTLIGGMGLASVTLRRRRLASAAISRI